MRIVVLLCCVWLASAGTVPEKCDGVTFDGKYYDKEILLPVSGASSLSYAKSTNTLFFSYYDPKNATEENPLGLAYYNIDTKEFKDIIEVSGGYKTAINTATDEVYLASSYGIQKFDPQTKEVKDYAADSLTFVMYMYFNKILFYTSARCDTYSYDGHETKKVSVSNVSCIEVVMGDEKDYYFVNRTGLYRVLDNKEEAAEKYADFQSNIVITLVKDNNNKIYVFRNETVYVPNEKDKKLDKVTNIEDMYGLTFDKDNNIIYSDKDNIYKLTLSQAKCPVV